MTDWGEQGFILKNKEDKEGRDIMSSDGYLLNERDVLRFDRDGVPLE